MDDTNKTKIEIIILVAVVSFIISILVFFLQNTASKNSQRAPSTQNQTGVEQPGAITRGESNTFSGTNEKNANVITPKPTVHYDFKYQVDPALEKNQHSFLPFSSVYAATKCDLSTIPSTAKLYVLKNHFSPEEAKELAKKNGIVAEPAAMPDTGGYTSYIFTDPTTSSDYITVAEPSGNSQYHHAIASIDQQQPMDVALDTAKKKLTDLGLFSNLTAMPPTVNQNDTKRTYDFTWRGAWDGVTVVDPVSIKSSSNGSVCDTPPSVATNYINVQVASDGTSISDITNKIRNVKNTISVPIQSLSASIAENAGSPLIEPEVFSSTAPTTIGTVNIDQAIVAYIDAGDALSCYIPAYVTSGTAGASRVIAIFPAVSLTYIKDNCIKAKAAAGKNVGDIYKPDGAAGTLNYSTFALAVPTLTAPTLAAPVGAGNCYGNLVDYLVSCNTYSGTSVCNGYVSVAPSDDPYDTCNKKACFKPVADKVYSYTPGLDVCHAFAQFVIESQGKLLPASYKTVTQSTSIDKYGRAKPDGKVLYPNAEDVVCGFKACQC